MTAEMSAVRKLLLIAIFCLIKVRRCEINMSATSFVGATIARLFRDNHCVCLTLNEDTACTHIFEEQLPFALAIVSREKLLDKQADNRFCEGYVIIDDDYERVKDMFLIDKNDHYPFKVYRRVLIIFYGRWDFTTSDILSTTNWMGNDVLILDGLPATSNIILKVIMTIYSFT